MAGRKGSQPEETQGSAPEVEMCFNILGPEGELERSEQGIPLGDEMREGPQTV